MKSCADGLGTAFAIAATLCLAWPSAAAALECTALETVFSSNKACDDDSMQVTCGTTLHTFDQAGQSACCRFSGQVSANWRCGNSEPSVLNCPGSAIAIFAQVADQELQVFCLGEPAPVDVPPPPPEPDPPPPHDVPGDDTTVSGEQPGEPES